MKNIFPFRVLLSIVFIGFYCVSFAQSSSLSLPGNCVKETFIYATKDTNVLRLDKYALKNNTTKQPCVFFLFGGSFRGGVRDNVAYFNYFNALVQKGYTVISIDYRLGMKNVKGFPKDGSLLKRAVDMSVEDLYDATAFTVQHAKEWNVDTGKIIISGSSAGALAVLKAEYENDNQTELSKKLPANFRYAGVISFAGAIFSTNENDLAWSRNKPCPILMFHGDADIVVPYEYFQLGNMGIYGSRYIASKLDSLQTPYWLYTVAGGSHKVSMSPMNKNHSEIFQFIDEMVIAKKSMVLNTEYREPGQTISAQKPALEDFIKSNSK